MLDRVENRAALLGSSRFNWWPEWRDCSVAIVGCGPSAKKSDVDLLRGKVRVIAIKEAAADLCPWADVVYGCDAPWWIHRRGLPQLKGLKLCWDKHVPTQFPDIHPINIQETGKPVRYVNRLLIDESGTIGSGHNSGFQALNLALQFGAKRILLIGFDLNDNGGLHFYGRNNWFRANNPDVHQFERALRCFDESESVLTALGVVVVNASKASSIKAFPKMDVASTLRAWGL